MQATVAESTCSRTGHSMLRSEQVLSKEPSRANLGKRLASEKSEKPSESTEMSRAISQLGKPSRELLSAPSGAIRSEKL